jgi:radical SAM protein with 4Fe4S-binding SPASM domain
VETDGKGLLIVNGSRTLWLNETAVEYVKHIILDTPEAKTISQVRRRFAVSKKLARRDLAQIKRSMQRLEKNPDSDPLDLFKVDTTTTEGTTLKIPLHMYVYVTYDEPEKPLLDPVPPGRKVGFLSRREWEIVLERMHKMGIPCITLCGGEPTVRDDLDFLIQKASFMGMAVGLETSGPRLKNQAYLKKLITAGLDSITIKFYTSDLKSFRALHKSKNKNPYRDCVEGIKNSLRSGLDVQVFIMLTKETLPHLSKTIDFLGDLGVRTVLLGLFPQSNPDVFTSSGIGKEHLAALLEEVDRHKGKDVKVMMKTPIGATQAGIDTGPPLLDCTGAYSNMALEPNGDVLVCKNLFQTIGNIITSEWNTIWEHPIAQRVRHREDLPSHCGGCPDLVLCGGGCPEWLFFTEEPTGRDYEVVVEKKTRE